MGVKKCDIFYDSNSASYYPGQTINGKLEFTFDSLQKFRAIHIEFKGEANTFWNENKKRKNANGEEETYTVHYNGHEEYFNIRYNLAGQQELPEGLHSFPFTCALPPTLPNSFEGECGYVRYTIKVVMDRPWKTDREFNFEFRILSVVDLNRKPGLIEPVHREVCESFCCCCCESGPFQMTVTLPCSGYTPNQKLPITIDCDNASNVRIKYLNITLERLITYYVHNPQRKSKTKSIEIASHCTEGVEEGENAKFEEELIIPENCPPSDLENCSIIDISYALQIKAKVGSCHESPKSVIKITIGHIPIEEKINELGGGKWEPPVLNPSMPTPAPPSGVIGWNPDQTTNSTMNYPPSQTTYPPTSSPYPPPTSSPYPPPTSSPYPPPTSSPYPPPTSSPYPPPTSSPYPPPTSSPYPPPNQSYQPPPSENPYYVPSNPPYPSSNSNYPPPSNTQYPPQSNSPYPPSNPQYPSSNIGYPAPMNPSYPGQAPPVQGQYPSYPPSNPGMPPSAPPPQ